MFGFGRKKKKKSDEKNLAAQAVLGSQANELNKYSDAAQEFVKSYTGYDAASGKNLQKSLSKIAAGERNLPGQRGYSAEVLDTAKRNSKEVIKGSKVRYSRVDDLPGHAVNETLYDIMAISENGREMTTLGTQMKFNQGDPASVADKLLSKTFRQKYPHGRYSVPKDRYDAIKQALADKEAELTRKLKSAKQQGSTQLANTIEELNYVKKAKKNLVPSEITLDEANRAVINPKLTTAKEIGKVGHEVGLNYAKSSGCITGVMSLTHCIEKVIKGEMSPEDAAKTVLTDTTKGAVSGYAVGQANTALAAVLKNSSKETLRKLGKSSAPAQIVTFVMSAFRIVDERLEGKISDEECFHNLAKSGLGIMGSFKAGALAEIGGKKIGAKIGGTLGAAAGPVAAIAASIVASVVIDATYEYAVATLKAPGIAKQERIEIEKQCKELHKELAEYRENFKNTYIAYTEELTTVFGNSLSEMAHAIKINDADSFITSANAITRSLGGSTQFDTVEEFEEFLDSDEAFEL